MFPAVLTDYLPSIGVCILSSILAVSVSHFFPPTYVSYKSVTARTSNKHFLNMAEISDPAINVLQIR